MTGIYEGIYEGNRSVIHLTRTHAKRSLPVLLHHTYHPNTKILPARNAATLNLGPHQAAESSEYASTASAETDQRSGHCVPMHTECRGGGSVLAFRAPALLCLPPGRQRRSPRSLEPSYRKKILEIMISSATTVNILGHSVWPESREVNKLIVGFISRQHCTGSHG